MEVAAVGTGQSPEHDGSFEDFAIAARARLTKALAGTLGPSRTPDAVAGALEYAWENWPELSGRANPVGYLYRVAQTRARSRKQGHLPAPASIGLPEIEPRLVPSLLALPRTQRTAVWLVHACGWTYAETAEAMSVSVSAVGTHVERALRRLRRDLGDVED